MQVGTKMHQQAKIAGSGKGEYRHPENSEVYVVNDKESWWNVENIAQQESRGLRAGISICPENQGPFDRR